MIRRELCCSLLAWASLLRKELWAQQYIMNAYGKTEYEKLWFHPNNSSASVGTLRLVYIAFMYCNLNEYWKIFNHTAWTATFNRWHLVLSTMHARLHTQLLCCWCQSLHNEALTQAVLCHTSTWHVIRGSQLRCHPRKNGQLRPFGWQQYYKGAIQYCVHPSGLVRVSLDNISVVIPDDMSSGGMTNYSLSQGLVVNALTPAAQQLSCHCTKHLGR